MDPITEYEIFKQEVEAVRAVPDENLFTRLLDIQRQRVPEATRIQGRGMKRPSTAQGSSTAKRARDAALPSEGNDHATPECDVNATLVFGKFTDYDLTECVLNSDRVFTDDLDTSLESQVTKQYTIDIVVHDSAKITLIFVELADCQYYAKVDAIPAELQDRVTMMNEEDIYKQIADLHCILCVLCPDGIGPIQLVQPFSDLVPMEVQEVDVSSFSPFIEGVGVGSTPTGSPTGQTGTFSPDFSSLTPLIDSSQTGNIDGAQPVRTPSPSSGSSRQDGPHLQTLLGQISEEDLEDILNLFD